MTTESKYKNWIRTKRLVVFPAIVAVLLSAAGLLHNGVVSIVLILSALPFLYITVFLYLAYHQLSASGGGFQPRVHDLIVDTISLDVALPRYGKLLDIGTGSGMLLIKALQRYPELQGVGIDYWGASWDYSKKLAEDNAREEGVGERSEFVRASAVDLPFEDASFDVIVSCLTFHEVRDQPDKAKLLQEALRVLRSGGQFVFIDLFADEKTFGSLDLLLESLHTANISSKGLAELIGLPRVLRDKKVLGNAVLIYGVK